LLAAIPIFHLMPMPPNGSDCAGRWITPGLVDCHTHLVFGGKPCPRIRAAAAGRKLRRDRARRRRIVSTVAATRASSEAELVAGALPRLDALIGG